MLHFIEMVGGVYPYWLNQKAVNKIAFPPKVPVETKADKIFIGVGLVVLAITIIVATYLILEEDDKSYERKKS